MPIRFLGTQTYSDTFQSMKSFTEQRLNTTLDEIWLVEHPAVYTQGLNGKPEHLLTSNIQTVQTDRGGQVTFHGKGQLIVYLLLDLKRANLGVKQLINTMENAIIVFLADFQIQAQARTDAPGVYVSNQKIASLGIKVKKSCSYHGLAINIDMDLTPFLLINPCGLAGMQMTQLKDHTKLPNQQDLQQKFLKHLTELLPTIRL